MASGVTVNTAIGKLRDGSYSARIEVQATGEARYFHYGFGKTPLAALKAASKHIDEDLAFDKRGRKPSGFKSLKLLQGGWA